MTCRNLKTEQKPSGSVYLYEYDDLDRLTSVYFKEDSNSKRSFWKNASIGKRLVRMNRTIIL